MTNINHKAAYVLNKLVPQGGWIVYGDEYSGIVWANSEPLVSEQEFNQAMLTCEEDFAEEQQIKESKKQAAFNKLQNLGLTEEDIKLILE